MSRAPDLWVFWLLVWDRLSTSGSDPSVGLTRTCLAFTVHVQSLAIPIQQAVTFVDLVKAGAVNDTIRIGARRA